MAREGERRRGRAFGLLEYYRSYDDPDPEELNRELRERRARERAHALQQVPLLDLSHTEWPDLPDAEVVNAAIAVARGRLNGYPDPRGDALRAQLGERHGVEPHQIAVGNGAGELMQTAAYLLLSAGDELVTPWPSYPLYPLMASRVGARPVAVDVVEGAADPEALLRAVGEHTRLLVICNPNDPTGGYLSSEALGALLSRLPEQVHVLLDEAYAQFQDREPEDAALRLVDEHPRLFVFRTFSKAYGLSGLRGGYAIGSAEASSVVEALSPAHGVNALTQAAMSAALRRGDRELGRRREMVIATRRTIAEGLRDLPVEAPDSEANFVWLRAPGMTGADLAARLERRQILVAHGGPLGDEDHVRAAVRGPAAAVRLVTALAEATRDGDGAP